MESGRLHTIAVITRMIVMIAAASTASNAQPIRGTLVVAVPVQEGLVACSDKRLFNIDTGTYRDNSVKIRKVSDDVLFVATHTVGFYDRKEKKIVFDAFEVAANYTSRNRFRDSREFWDGLKTDIRNKLRDYFATRSYSEWPMTDRSNNNLLFNLVFYSVDADRARSFTLQVFYEKKRTPVLSVTGPVTAFVRSPKLGGKGRELLAYIARNPSHASDPTILKFDAARFDIHKTSVSDAVDFSRTLFRIASTGIPKAQISATFDCALLSYLEGFRWVEGGPAAARSAASLLIQDGIEGKAF
jgi:hypothetical protein